MSTQSKRRMGKASPEAAHALWNQFTKLWREFYRPYNPRTRREKYSYRSSYGKTGRHY